MYSLYAQHCDKTPVEEKSLSENSTVDLKLSDGMTLCLTFILAHRVWCGLLICPAYESTRYGAQRPFKCAVQLRIDVRGIAPLVFSTLYDVVWADSRSGHFTELSTYTPYE
jgi:hypothetical protein